MLKIRICDFLLLSLRLLVENNASDVWAVAFCKEKYRKNVAMVQSSGGLRIATSYRTVSEEAALVTAEIIPIALLIEETFISK